METHEPGPSPLDVDPDDPCPAIDNLDLLRGSPKDLGRGFAGDHIKFVAFRCLPVKLPYWLHRAFLQKEMPRKGLDLSLNRGHRFFMAIRYIGGGYRLGNTGIYQLSQLR
jgi:hypothetical protein